MDGRRRGKLIVTTHPRAAAAATAVNSSRLWHEGHAEGDSMAATEGSGLLSGNATEREKVSNVAA